MKIRESIDREIAADFSIDRARIRRDYRRSRARRLTGGMIAVFAAAVIFAAGASAFREPQSPGATPDTSAPHTFGIKAFAAQIDSPPQREIPDDDLLYDPCRIIVQYYVRHGDEGGVYDTYDEISDPDAILADGGKIYSTFCLYGDQHIGVWGEGIEYLTFHSDNASFYYDYLNEFVNDHTIRYDPENPQYNTLSWCLPEEMEDWFETEGENGREVDFSAAPDDVVTITATFSDGAVARRRLHLYYNDSGYLVIETEDGVRYNDFA